MPSQTYLPLSSQSLPACACGTTPSRTPLAGVHGRGLSSLATALIVAALPKCPMCLLAYAGLLGGLGLGSSTVMALYEAWLLPVSALFLGLTVILLTHRAHRRHGYGPALAAAVAGPAILLGKFRFDWLPMVYAGLFLMVVAVTWNTWPRKVS